MACLGGTVPTGLLAAAVGTTGAGLDERVLPALEDGLLLLERGASRSQGVLRFPQGSIQQALHSRMGDIARQRSHLALARRLAPLTSYATEAAEQYLCVLSAITTGQEAGEAARLFAGAAAKAARLLHHEAAERYAAAAIGLLERAQHPDHPEITRLLTGRLTALYSLGRHTEGDRLFTAIAQRQGDALCLAEASSLQVLSLCSRGRHTEAVPIGLAMLAQLGIRPPAEDLHGYVTRGLAGLLDWVSADAAINAVDRITTNDRLVRAIARLINRILPTAQLYDPLVGAWLAVENQRLWSIHGVCPELVANLARTASSPIVFGEDYRTAYAMARHAISIGAAYGYEPETSLARQNFATFAIHWFEPLEHTLEQVAIARPGLIQGGEIQAVCINDISSLAAMLDCAPALENSAAELANAREYAAHTGSHHLADIFANHHRLLQALTGEIDPASRLAEAPDPSLAGKPLSLFGLHCGQAMLALLCADDAALALHSTAAMAWISRVGGAYRCMTANLLHALLLARQARAPDSLAAIKSRLPAAFHVLRAWFAARAADAPGNFEHLLNFIDAEAAWTEGDIARAAHAFDHALQLQSGTARARPWHHALIAERAGLFNMALGMDYFGRGMLRDAQARYGAWGAVAVVRRLNATHGFLDAAEGPRSVAQDDRSASISSDTLDIMAVLRASQALSSQRTLGALYAQVVETLAAMTGATAVKLVVWDDSRGAWCLPAQGDLPAEPVEDVAARLALPLSAFRIVERTQVPLVVDDALLDDRFARDPYFAAMERCSLLVLPVQSQGAARAVLILENRLSRGVFSHARLNLVTLVASQLAVSLDNAQLYASLERRVAERTEALAVANRRLEQLSISDALTGLANRRRFDEVFASEWRRALHGSASIGLVLIDIDYFKRYNDHYGHVGGDRCLRAVASALQASVRQDVDLAARYGGEEFALILPGADLRAAAAAAARAQQAIVALREPHAASPLHYVTISQGVAARIPDETAGAEQFLKAADAALYRAKQQGRNRLVTQQRETAGDDKEGLLF
jgi:diguanylate cyclase (GGDEF)-like protein